MKIIRNLKIKDFFETSVSLRDICIGVVCTIILCAVYVMSVKVFDVSFFDTGKQKILDQYTAEMQNRDVAIKDLSAKLQQSEQKYKTLQVAIKQKEAEIFNLKGPKNINETKERFNRLGYIVVQ